MFTSIRARFVVLFAALVLAPIVILSTASVLESRKLARRSVQEYSKSLERDAERGMQVHVNEMARLQDRTFRGIERRAAALAAQSDLLFASREMCEKSGKWDPRRLNPGGYGWQNAPGEPAGIWIPKTVAPEEVLRDLQVLAHIEEVLLAEPHGEGMTQWYVIHRSGVSILVPNSQVVPTEEGFDPRESEFYVPAMPANNPLGRVVWTGVYNDPAGQGVMISALAPIGKGPAFQGVIGIDVNTRTFQEEIARAGEPWDYAFLLDGHGRALLVTPEGYRDFGVSAPAHTQEVVLDWKVAGIPDPELRSSCETMSGSDSGLTRARIGGRERIVAHRKLPSTGWILAAVSDLDRMMAPAHAMRSTQEQLHRQFLVTLVGSGAILILSTILFGWFLTQRVTRPLRSLAAAAKEIGRGSPETVLGPAGPDEIGTLADTLRHMVRDREVSSRAIAEAQKLSALGGMASGICHELNNLLAPILGFAQVLDRGTLTPEQRGLAQRIERAARSAREIVGSLLDSTRELAGQRSETDLNAVAKEAVSQLEAACRSAAVKVEWDLDPALPSTMANPDLLQRVVYNLADNAVQAMAAGPTPRALSIRTRASDGRLVLTVDDSGPGIPADHLARVFDPFFTTKPPGSGTGLGLSVALSAIRSHGGTLVAANRPEGGARFTASLPRISPESWSGARPPTPPPAGPATPPLTRPRILVVDDEDSIRVLIRHTLGQDNEVTACESGREALDLLASREFDLVLCDLRLRDISGREVYGWIRKNRQDLLGRFMVITGDTHGEETRSFLDEFGTPCLTKPFDLDDLSARVRECLGGGGSA